MLLLINTLLSMPLCTVHKQIVTELNGARKRIGDSSEAHSVWGGVGCRKSNQHKCEVEYRSVLRGTRTCEEMCVHSRKSSNVSGEVKFGIGFEGVRKC